MKTSSAAIFAIAIGLAGAAIAQPSGGPAAKGNAPLKAAHTVNDGVAKPGANSFTEAQARTHILKSGYSAVSGLTKGADGVWRGSATKNGAPINVALDFKGNVSEDMAAPPMAAPAPVVTRHSSSSMSAPAASATGATSAATATAPSATVHHHRHHHHHHHHAMSGAKMDGQGAAVSGVDRDANGISDKEDRALQH